MNVVVRVGESDLTKNCAVPGLFDVILTVKPSLVPSDVNGEMYSEVLE